MSKTVKVSKLTGAVLDWAVAKCEGVSFEYYFPMRFRGSWISNDFRYSTDWAQGGPIIEREHVSIEATRIGGLGDRWMATSGDCAEFADKPLIAAMRCYVASKLGNTIEVPEELL